MNEPVFLLTRTPPSAYRALLWDTFFVQRNRGVDLAVHFPWMGAEHESIRYGVLLVDGGVVAGLVLRGHEPLSDGRETRVASIGLVCVATTYRGRGLSANLLTETLNALKTLGFDAAILWTGKPTVYSTLGFAGMDRNEFGWIERPLSPARHVPDLHVTRWPDLQEAISQNRGLPPFALYAQRVTWADQNASAILLFDSHGPAVAEWSGATEALAKMFTVVMPPRWRLNALNGDDLPIALEASGATVNLQPTRLQMWKSLRPRFEGINWSMKFSLRVLDRI